MKSIEKITCQDIDGNQYSTLVVGDKVWMTENLKVTRYNDGTPIPILEDMKEWRDDTKGAMCYYDHDKSKGALYNSYAVDACRLAPKGWSAPINSEWEELNKVVDGWNAQFGGYRYGSGNGFYGLGSYGFWWSSTPYSSSNAWNRYLNSTGVGTTLGLDYNDRSNGFSIRCVRNITKYERFIYLIFRLFPRKKQSRH